MERENAHPLVRVVGESMVGGAVFGAEMARWTSLRQSYNGGLFPPTQEQIRENPELVDPPALNPENTPDFIYESLQHSGNVMDGFFLTMGFFYFMKLVPKVKDLDEKIKLGTAWVTANLVVSGVETGLFFGQSADPLDIPAGVAGSTLFLGARFASQFLGAKKQESAAEIAPS